MKTKNKVKKAGARIAKENNNRAHKIYQENKYDHQTPYQTRRSKYGTKKPKRKDHR